MNINENTDLIGFIVWLICSCNLGIPSDSVELKINYRLGIAKVFYRCMNSHTWQLLVDGIDVSYLSDEGVNGEPGEVGGFTGLFNFIGAVDAYQHESYADFDYYKVKNHME